MSVVRGAARLLRLAALVLVGGCVYYNGMYNTNRLAKSARKAERDGRPFEAQGYWGQVITRADSLVLRHPRSKYADQATVLRGLALARLNQCQDAVGPLAHAAQLPRPGLIDGSEIAHTKNQGRRMTPALLVGARFVCFPCFKWQGVQKCRLAAPRGSV